MHISLYILSLMYISIFLKHCNLTSVQYHWLFYVYWTYLVPINCFFLSTTILIFSSWARHCDLIFIFCWFYSTILWFYFKSYFVNKFCKRIKVLCWFILRYSINTNSIPWLYGETFQNLKECLLSLMFYLSKKSSSISCTLPFYSQYLWYKTCWFVSFTGYQLQWS